jgi:translocation and assembly module TamB
VREKGELNLMASLEALDLSRLSLFLPAGVEIQGQLDADLKASGSVQQPAVTFRLQPGDGLIRLPEKVETLKIGYRNAGLQGRFERDRGQLDFQLGLGKQGQLTGQLGVGAQSQGERSLTGTLSADFADLGEAAVLLPVLDELTGSLHVRGTVGGTLSRPRVAGQLEILDAGLHVPMTGTRVQGLGLKLASESGSRIGISGQMRSGEGQLTLAGEADIASLTDPRVDLQIRGQDFQVLNLPEARVSISPQLRLRVHEDYHLEGRVSLPRSHIKLRQLPPKVVRLSKDEVVVGEQKETAKIRPPVKLLSRVSVDLGNEVTFQGFGLNTGLNGSLQLKTDRQGASLEGIIKLRDARYMAFGQDLKVEQGRLIFSGIPSRPNIDLRAMRLSRDGLVKAYLTVTGSVSQPNSRVYSEPSLPESEALAYLLTGKGLDAHGEGEGADIMAAALAMGFSSSDPVLQDLGHRFGIDEVSFEGGSGELEESAVVLGKYLNPDLYLGYSQKLFESEGAVLLRLRLTKNLGIESRSGNEQEVDLFYKIEVD